MAVTRSPAPDSLARTQTEVAYRGTREWVLSRRTRIGDAIDVPAVASYLDVDDDHVADALVRLRHESLVRPAPPDAYTAVPIPLERATRMFDARAVIEVGIVEVHLREAAALVDELEDIAHALAAVVAEAIPGFERFLALSRRYHEALIGAAGSEELVAAYDQLAITALWRGALADTDWWNRFDVDHHAQLTAALRAGDAAGAKRQILDHRGQVKSLVRDVFVERGGVL